MSRKRAKLEEGEAMQEGIRARRQRPTAGDRIATLRHTICVWRAGQGGCEFGPGQADLARPRDQGRTANRC